jgi:hypothetical protein
MLSDIMAVFDAPSEISVVRVCELIEKMPSPFVNSPPLPPLPPQTL